MQEERQTPGQGPEPPAPAPPEDAFKNTLDEKLARLPEKLWLKCQLLGGILLGLAGGLCLFHLGGTETFGSVGLVLAVLILLLFPNILQRNLTRSIQKGRTASVITFAAFLLVELVVQLVL